mgnify:CR=1 FL=1
MTSVSAEFRVEAEDVVTSEEVVPLSEGMTRGGDISFSVGLDEDDWPARGFID